MHSRVKQLSDLLSESDLFGAASALTKDFLFEIFGGSGLQLVGMRADGSVFEHWSDEYDEAGISQYLDYYHTINPRVRVAAFDRPFVTDSMIFDADSFRRTEFFSWYYESCKLSDNIAFHAPTHDGGVYALALGRDRRYGFCTDDDIDNAKALAPKIISNLNLASFLERGIPFYDALLNSVNNSGVIFVMDAAGHVVFASERAKEFQRQTGRVRTEGGVLSIPGGNQLLGELLSVARRSQEPTRSRPGALPMGRLEVTPIRIRTLLSRRDLFLLRLIEPHRLSNVGGQLEFTAAESEVAALLIAGFSPRDIAIRRCVSYHTVRNQVAALRDKVGAKSIQQLMQFLGYNVSS